MDRRKEIERRVRADLGKQVNAAEGRYRKAHEALRKYGTHKKWCVQKTHPLDCNCGYSEALNPHDDLLF